MERITKRDLPGKVARVLDDQIKDRIDDGFVLNNGVKVKLGEYGKAGGMFSPTYTGASIKFSEKSGKTLRSMRLKYGLESEGEPVNFDAKKLLKKVDEVAEILKEKDVWRKAHTQKVNADFEKLQTALPSFRLSQEYSDEADVISVFGKHFSLYRKRLEMTAAIDEDPYIVHVDFRDLRVPSGELESFIRDMEAVADKYKGK